MILGVDVFSGYGKIDWPRASAAGVRFALPKHTQGNDGCDPRARENVEGCRNVGIAAAPYFFAYPLPSDPKHPGRGPKEQAGRFFADAKGLGTQPGDLPPALDLEWPPHFEREKGTSRILDRWTQWNTSASQIVAWALECLAEMERLWSRVPMIYTYPDFWHSLGEAGRDPAFAKYPLWIANYTHLAEWLPPQDARPIVPAPWTDWSVWQFSADGSRISIPGIGACPIDRNAIKDEDTFRRLKMDRPVDSIVAPAAVGTYARR